jgi:ATP-dependent RNA helicase RhlE
MTFKELHLVEPILKALDDQGYTTPTPIQEQSIPILLRGKDLLGCAQTGTGKTAAFSIPILQNIFLDKERNIRNRKVKALIVTPTRELAIQIYDNFEAYAKYTNIKSTVIFGGVKQGQQTDALRRGVDVLVATPGRLLDLISQGFITLRDIDYLVLDEADQMLDMGFIHDIKKIIAKLPVKRQSLFFSATMPSAIVTLSRQILGEFDTVTIKPTQATAERVEQAIYFVNKRNKIKLLRHLIETKEVSSTLVFSRTKHGADKIVKLLRRDEIYAEAIHGNKSQNARQRALSNFKKGKTTVLVATDIAARGIDVSDLELVVNYDLPNVPETYVHRIGRTGRASASGEAVSFCNMEERAFLKSIQRLIRQTIPVVEEHPFVDDGSEIDPPIQSQQRGRGGDNQRRRNGNNGNSSNRSNSNSNRRRW